MAVNKQWQWPWLLAFGVGAVVGWMSYRFSHEPVPRVRQQAAHPFVLAVKVKFPTTNDLAEFKVLFQPLANYVEERELGAMSYMLMDSDKNPLHIMIMERYVSKDYYLNVHKNSDEFKSFRGRFQQLVDRGAVIDGDSYLESSMGFM